MLIVIKADLRNFACGEELVLWKTERIAQSGVSLTGEWEMENPEWLQKALSGERKSCYTEYLQGYLCHEATNTQYNRTLSHVRLLNSIFTFVLGSSVIITEALKNECNCIHMKGQKAEPYDLMIHCKWIRSACLCPSAYITTQLLSGTVAMLIFYLAHHSPGPSLTLLQHFQLCYTHCIDCILEC